MKPTLLRLKKELRVKGTPYPCMITLSVGTVIVAREIRSGMLDDWLDFTLLEGDTLYSAMLDEVVAKRVHPLILFAEQAE